MNFNNQTFKSESTLGSMDRLESGYDREARPRVALAYDVVNGVAERTWTDRFNLLEGKSNTVTSLAWWGADVFKCIQVSRPHINTTDLHTVFCRSIADACFRNESSAFRLVASALCAWETHVSLELVTPETSAQMCERIIQALGSHSIFDPIRLERFYTPSAFEIKTMKAESYNIFAMPLLDRLEKADKGLVDAMFRGLKGERLVWVLTNFPKPVVDGYFERHPDAPQYADRLELDLGL